MHVTTQTLIIVETHSESLVLFSIFKSTHPPTNKKPRLESIKLQSGYETDLSLQNYPTMRVTLYYIRYIPIFL